MQRLAPWSVYGPVLALPTASSYGHTYFQGMLGNVVSLPEGRRWSQRHTACAQTDGGRLSSSQGHIHAFTQAHMSSDHHAQTTCKPCTEHRLTCSHVR